jgi:hypothetical protein
MTDRFNLWVTTGTDASIVCYGSFSEINDLAIAAGITENVHVLPDGADSPVEAPQC